MSSSYSLTSGLPRSVELARVLNLLILLSATYPLEVLGEISSFLL